MLFNFWNTKLRWASFSFDYQKYSQPEGKTQDFFAKQISTVGICGSAKKFLIIPETKFLTDMLSHKHRKSPAAWNSSHKKGWLSVVSHYISLTWAGCILLTQISHLKCLSPHIRSCQGKSLAMMSSKATILHYLKIMPSKYIVMLTGNGINTFSNLKAWRTVMCSYLNV